MGRLPAFFWLLLVTTVWGATFPVVKVALEFASFGVFLVLRFALAFLLLFLLLRGRRARWDWPAVRCGLALFFGYALQTWGLVTALPSRSAFITSTSVILVPLLQGLMHRRFPSLEIWLAVFSALAGLALLLQPESAPFTWGDVLTFGCALAFAAHVLALSQAVRRQDPAAVNLVQMGVVALFSPLLLVADRPFLQPSAALVISLLVTGYLASALAFFTMAKVLTVLTPPQVAVGLAFEPVAAFAISALAGLEEITLSAVFGGVLVAVGVVLAARNRD